MSSGQGGYGARMVVAMSDNAAVATSSVMERTPVMELAAKAAEEIRTRGWHRGRLGSLPLHVRPTTAAAADLATCRVCLIGAIHAAETGNPFYGTSASGDVIVAVARHLGFRFAAVSTWNDEAGRTVDEVLAVLDAVAEGR